MLTLTLVSGPRNPPSAPARSHAQAALVSLKPSVTATIELRSPWSEALSRARGGGDKEPPTARRRAAAPDSLIVHEGAIRRVAIEAPGSAVPARAPVHTPVASMKRVERIEPLSESIVPNAAFGRSLRSAGSSSGLPSGQDLFPYSMSALSFQAPGDLRSFSYGASLVKLGPARLTALLGSTHSRGREDAATLKTSFVVPAFHKSITLNLGGGYDHLQRPETTVLPYYPYDASSTADDEGANTAAGDPASPIATTAKSADTERYTYSAGAAVPVTRDLHFGIGYTAQRLSGEYGVAPNALPANRKDAYSGSLTFAPRGGKSTLSIVGAQYRYSDDAAPNAAYKERRGDVMFSVKF